jgi:hypothetical protein
MLPDTGIDDVKKQRNAEYAKHINDPVLSSLKMEGIHSLFLFGWSLENCICTIPWYTTHNLAVQKDIFQKSPSLINMSFELKQGMRICYIYSIKKICYLAMNNCHKFNCMHF